MMLVMKRWMILLLLPLCLVADEELTDHQKKIFKEAQKYIPEILPTQSLGVPTKGTFKTKYKFKGASKRKHTLKEENLYDAREIHIPKGVELNQTISAGSEIGDFLKLLSEFNLSGKYLHNEYKPGSRIDVSNALKCKLGLTLTPTNFFELEGFLEESMSQTFKLQSYQPKNYTFKPPAFDQYTIKFKFKY